MIGASIRSAVENVIQPYADSRLAALLADFDRPWAIKFVQSKWAAAYTSPGKLKISETPALTWGTATYVTPISFPLSSALYGRIGLVTPFDAKGWRVFDATQSSGRVAYVNWVRAQPAFSDLLLTVHSTHANHLLRNRFREEFEIDCVLFHPDQEAEIHTDRGNHVWMAVTDWASPGTIDGGMSGRLGQAKFVVLMDEDFLLQEANGLPIGKSPRVIERVTETIVRQSGMKVAAARSDSTLPHNIISHYNDDGYLHVYIEP
jgi:hypothetical protein